MGIDTSALRGRRSGTVTGTASKTDCALGHGVRHLLLPQKTEYGWVSSNRRLSTADSSKRRDRTPILVPRRGGKRVVDVLFKLPFYHWRVTLNGDSGCLLSSSYPSGYVVRSHCSPHSIHLTNRRMKLDWFHVHNTNSRSRREEEEGRLGLDVQNPGKA